MAQHLKTLPEYFQAVIDGRKPFEIRNNDRNFKVGERYILEEFVGTEIIQECPDYYSCDTYGYIYDDEALSQCPFKRESCKEYSKEVYTGRRCLIKIKNIFPLDKIGFENYVAFTFDILNVIDKKE